LYFIVIPLTWICLVPLLCYIPVPYAFDSSIPNPTCQLVIYCFVLPIVANKDLHIHL